MAYASSSRRTRVHMLSVSHLLGTRMRAFASCVAPTGGCESKSLRSASDIFSPSSFRAMIRLLCSPALLPATCIRPMTFASLRGVSLSRCSCMRTLQQHPKVSVFQMMLSSQMILQEYHLIVVFLLLLSPHFRKATSPRLPQHWLVHVLRRLPNIFDG